MRNFLVRIILLILFLGSEKSKGQELLQDSLLAVPLETVIGQRPLPLQMVFSKPVEVKDNYLGATSHFKIVWHYQPAQNVFYNFLDGKIDSTRLNNSLKFYKVERNELTLQRINESITVHILFFPDSMVTIIPDQNNNGTIKDDNLYRIPFRKRNSNGFGYYESLPAFRIDNIQYYEGKKIKTKSAHIRLAAYYDTHQDIEFDTVSLNNIYLEGFEYRYGFVKIGSANYNIYVNQPIFHIKPSEPNPKNILIVHAGRPVAFNDGGMIISLKDTISLDKYMVSPITIAENWDTIFLSVKENNNRFFGFRQGDLVPGMTGRGIAGNDIKLLDETGKNYILLDFFGSWCAPCIANLPKLKSLLKKYSNKNFRILGVANEREKSFEQLSALVKREKLSWPVIAQNNTDRQIIDRAGVNSYPTYILISPGKKVLYRGSGSESDFIQIEKILGSASGDQ